MGVLEAFSLASSSFILYRHKGIYRDLLGRRLAPNGRPRGVFLLCGIVEILYRHKGVYRKLLGRRIAVPGAFFFLVALSSRHIGIYRNLIGISWNGGPGAFPFFVDYSSSFILDATRRLSEPARNLWNVGQERLSEPIPHPL